MKSFYVADQTARQLLGHQERPLSGAGRKLKLVFRGLDDHGAQVAIDELDGRNFSLSEVNGNSEYGHRRLSVAHQVAVLGEVMRGVEVERIQRAVERLNQSGTEVMIRDRSTRQDPMMS